VLVISDAEKTIVGFGRLALTPLMTAASQIALMCALIFGSLFVVQMATPMLTNVNSIGEPAFREIQSRFYTREFVKKFVPKRSR